MAEIDFKATYRVKSMPGIAFYLTGWERVFDPLDMDYMNDDDYGYVNSDTNVVAIMVGDDREHIVDIDDLELIEDDVCSCGQIGCGWS